MEQKECGVFFLLYHKVEGILPKELDLPVHLFQKQMEFLKNMGRLVKYEEAVKILLSQQPLSRDLFVLTFDDGYEDFYTNVFPILQDLNLPAILFVTTGFIEDKIPYVLSSPPAQEVKPVSWEMLREIHRSGLVTLGSHTHTHLELPGQLKEKIVEELKQPIELFKERLGITIKHFAYPRAIWDLETEMFVKEFYESAVIGGYKKATQKGFNPYEITRMPILKKDGWDLFLAKIYGEFEKDTALIN